MRVSIDREQNRQFLANVNNDACKHSSACFDCNRQDDDWSTWNPVTYIRAEWKKGGIKKKDEPVGLDAATTLFVAGVVLPRACRIRARCICNEGCAPPITATSCHYARALHKTAGRLHRQSRRLSRSQSRFCALARALLIQPRALKCNPSRGWFIPRQCPPAGQDVARPFFMSLSPVSKISRSAREQTSERASERAKFDTYVLANHARRTWTKSTMIMQWKTITIETIILIYVWFLSNWKSVSLCNSYKWKIIHVKLFRWVSIYTLLKNLC